MTPFTVATFMVNQSLEKFKILAACVGVGL